MSVSRLLILFLSILLIISCSSVSSSYKKRTISVNSMQYFTSMVDLFAQANLRLSGSEQTDYRLVVKKSRYTINPRIVNSSGFYTKSSMIFSADVQLYNHQDSLICEQNAQESLLYNSFISNPYLDNQERDNQRIVLRDKLFEKVTFWVINCIRKHELNVVK